MEPQLKHAKLTQFSQDKALKQAVLEVLRETFLRKRSGEDTTMKAGRFIALELLQEAWNEVEGHVSTMTEEKPGGNRGL